jgi:hypothetical protein
VRDGLRRVRVDRPEPVATKVRARPALRPIRERASSLNDSPSSRRDATRLNRGYAVRSIDADRHPSNDHRQGTGTRATAAGHLPTVSKMARGYTAPQPVSAVFRSHSINTGRSKHGSIMPRDPVPAHAGPAAADRVGKAGRQGAQESAKTCRPEACSKCPPLRRAEPQHRALVVLRVAHRHAALGHPGALHALSVR